MNQLGNLISHHRKQKNYATQQLAQKLNVSVGHISNIENDRGDIFRLELLSRIIHELDIPLNEVVDSLVDTLDGSHIQNNTNDNMNTEALVDKYMKLLRREFESLVCMFNDPEKAADILGLFLIKELKTIKKLEDLK